MRKYLLTWYGITDLRASLGIEKNNGPILSALLAENYSHVLVLAYSNPEKDKNISENEFTQEFKTIDINNPQSIWDFINKFSNTEAAHNHFENWLKKQLEHHEERVKIFLKPVCLKYLNDTESIYEAAIKLLDSISGQKEEKLVTLYLSPGTPVMAFVWAFTALSHPDIKKRMIASSHPNKPPEVISLPNEWLEWHGKQINTQKSNHEQYDVIFHLFGEQRMPNLLGVLQFKSKVHVFVNSAKFPAGVMKQFITDRGFYEVSVDPFDPENVRSTILERIEELPSDVRIGFNLTGGTKLMYAGALNACRKVNATPFYFDSGNNKVVFLNDFKTEDIKTIDCVDTFVKLNGDELIVTNTGLWKDIPNINHPDRINLTKKLWQFRSRIAKLYGDLSNYNDEKNLKPFYINNNTGISLSLKENEKAEIIFSNKKGKDLKFSFNNWPDFAVYLSGGWLEEYTYMLLEPFVKSGHIKDLRIGLEVSFREKNKPTNTPSSNSMSDQLSNLLSGNKKFQSVLTDAYQELDIVFTDGRKLYIIECKAGNTKSDHIMKLENIVRYFGGIQGKGVLASCFIPNSKVVKKKIDNAVNLDSVAGRDFPVQLESYIKRMTRR